MKVLVSENNLTNIANAIRNKLNVDTKYKPSEMSAAIENLKRLPGNGIIETRTAVTSIEEMDFVSLVNTVISNQVTKISDISPYIIRSAKLSSTKVLVAWRSGGMGDNRITALICTIGQNDSVTVGNPITLSERYAMNFDVIALTESTVIVGSASSDENTTNITMLQINETTITELSKTTFNELTDFPVIKLAKIDSEKFVVVASNFDSMVGMCVSISNGTPTKFGNILNESGSYDEVDSAGNGIAVLAVNENTYAIFRSNPAQESAGITVFKCTVNEEGISKDAERVIPGEYGCSQVAATLLEGNKIFIAFGASARVPKVYGTVCILNPTIAAGSVIELDSTTYSSIDVTTVFNNQVVIGFGGFIGGDTLGTTKVALFAPNGNAITKILETTYTQLYSSTAIEYLGGVSVFVSGTIKYTENENSHVGVVKSELCDGVASTTHSTTFYGVAAAAGEVGETIEVCVPVRE